MSYLQIPQGADLVQALEPQTNAGELTGDYISMKTAHKVFVIFHMQQTTADQAILSLMKSTGVTPEADAVAVTATFPIWYNLDCTTDGYTRATDAATYTLSAGATNKMVIFQIDPSYLPGFDCIAAVVGASDVANLVAVTYLIENRYKGDGVPSVIID